MGRKAGFSERVARVSGPDGLCPADAIKRRRDECRVKTSPRDEAGALALAGKGGYDGRMRRL